MSGSGLIKSVSTARMVDLPVVLGGMDWVEIEEVALADASGGVTYNLVAAENVRRVDGVAKGWTRPVRRIARVVVMSEMD